MTHSPEVLHTRASRLLREIGSAGEVVTQDRLDQVAEQLYASDMPYVERNDLVTIALELHVERNRGSGGMRTAPVGTSRPKHGTKSPDRETRTAPSRKETPADSVSAGNGKAQKLTRAETTSLAVEFFRANPSATGNACYDYLLTLGTPSQARSSFAKGGGAAAARKSAGVQVPPGHFGGTRAVERAAADGGFDAKFEKIIQRIREAPNRAAAFAVATELHKAKLNEQEAAAVQAALASHGPEPELTDSRNALTSVHAPAAPPEPEPGEDSNESSPSTSLVAGSAASSEVKESEPAVLVKAEQVPATPAASDVTCFASAPGVDTVAELVAQLEADLAKVEATAAAIRTALDVVRKYAA